VNSKSRDLDKMPFANLDKYFGVKRKNEDFNEIQNCAKDAKTDSSDAIVSKCKNKVCDAWFSGDCNF
jgi:hypothetical protein